MRIQNTKQYMAAFGNNYTDKNLLNFKGKYKLKNDGGKFDIDCEIFKNPTIHKLFPAQCKKQRLQNPKRKKNA